MQWTPIRHLLSLVERAALQRTAESIRVLNRIHLAIPCNAIQYNAIPIQAIPYTAESIRVLNRIQILNASLFNNAL